MTSTPTTRTREPSGQRGRLGRHRRAIERGELALARHRRDEPSEQHVVLGRTVEALLEVCRHLEQLAELRIVGVKQVINQAVAKEYHLHLERDRLRRKRYRADEAVHLAEGFDADAVRRERAFEPLPRKRLGEQLIGVDQQIATVRAMEGAGLHQREIGHQRAEL